MGTVSRLFYGYWLYEAFKFVIKKERINLNSMHFNLDNILIYAHLYMYLYTAVTVCQKAYAFYQSKAFIDCLYFVFNIPFDILHPYTNNI